MRVETRFVTTGGKPQLWVRVYPDDCWIDTFEPDLSAAELANAKRYWEGVWRAGGQQGDLRAAWRRLVTAHGAGRAGWIVDTYRPVNLAQQPVKAAASDEVLVIATRTPLVPAEAAAIGAYWQAVWLADDDVDAEQAARTALEAAVGAARAAELVAGYEPYNLPDRPPAPLGKADVTLAVAFLVLPPDPPTRQAAWSRAPRVEHFPDRFVVLGYAGGQLTLQAIGGQVTLPLYVGPDPSGDPSTTIHADGPDLFVPDELRWMVDFDRAVAAGMGIAVDLTAQQAAAGFDRLLVVGLQLSASDADGAAALQDLLRHHQVGSSGLSLVPQGTPAHNATGAGTGYTALDDPDESFDDRLHAPLFTSTTDPLRKRDGQWVAEALGVDPALFGTVHGAGGLDQARARAMQRALWPATLGYWMDKMLHPVFGDAAVASTRWFFTQHVSGRGAVPALRIGGQPYGILPTTAFSRIGWLGAAPGTQAPDPELAYLGQLLPVLELIGADWAAMSAGVSHVGKAGDPHQTLLDIVGLHPTSVEHHTRSSESVVELYNIVNLGGLGPAFWQALIALALQASGDALLTKLGWSGTEPDILRHVFFEHAEPIANVVDDRPLSETDRLRACTDDGRNYIRWLIDAARKSLDVLTSEQGFTGDVSPANLLYLYLRHALMLGYYDTSYALHASAGFLTPAQLAAMKPEPVFVHVTGAAVPSESRFAALYKTQPEITGSASELVSDHITAGLTTLVEARGLADQLDALALLADAPTAQLERAFAEHVDVCSYRFDAWLLGIVAFQLQRMRAREGSGAYLGAYAWLEDLRPSASPLQPAQVPPDLVKLFAGPTPILSDPANGGYIHAPSLNHARTAAVLRSGYLANASPANPQTMAVNLSSGRVRQALSVLEGIRNGQGLGALLGYRFERGLHDDHGLAEVDKLIYPLRKAFPLAADALATTKTGPNVPIEAIEARNVLDGRKLIAQVRASGIAAYPYGLAGLPAATAAEAAAIDAETNAMLDVHDAIADLALAEGVHQAAQGNFERIAATLDAYSTGQFPPEPEVVQAPPSGIGLTHRVAVHLQPGLAPPAGATPRAQAEPALDAWLAGVLPPLDRVGCTVTWIDPAGGGQQQVDVTLADLGVRPIDVLSLVQPDDVQAMRELDDRVTGFVTTTAHPRPDAALHIAYMAAPAGAGALSLFEATPLVTSLRTLVARSRPLRATDPLLHGEASPEQDATVFVNPARITLPRGALDVLAADVGAFLATLSPLVADPVANRDAIVAGIDGFLEQAAALLDRGARFNLPQSGWGFAYAWRRTAFADLMAVVRELVERWNQRLADFDARTAAYDALPADTADAVRLQALRAAERLVATTPDHLAPAPLRAQLDVRRVEFAARLDQFVAVLGTEDPSFANAVAAVSGLLPVAQFDARGVDVSSFGDRAVTFAEDLVRVLSGHGAQVDARLAAVQAQLDLHDAAASATARAEALQAAARALLGEELCLVPEFALAQAQADEWANAVAASTGGTLLDYLTGTLKVDYPVDEWLYGAARVRPQLHEWETVLMLAGAFGRAEPALLPIQLPHQAGAPWVAMQFPPGYVLDSDRLRYTAHYAAPFDKGANQCGLLLDEWTEVVPSSTRTTGITFNFARPDSEPPQSILVVTPAAASGTWQWGDVVGALNETLDLARKRAVEPVHLDQTAYSRFLPATIMAAALYGISITTTLSAANDVLKYVKVSPHA